MLLVGSSFLHGYYFGQNKVNAAKTGWAQIQSMHFDVYFPAGEDNFGRLAALMAEDTYYYLKADLKFPAVSRITIIFYTSRQEFQTTNIIYPLLSEGVGGFTESVKNRVVVPFDGSYKNLEQVLTHELTHAYLNALDSGSPGSFFYLRTMNFPFWFSEGLPEFEAVGGTDVNNNAFILDLILNDRFPSLTDVSGYSAYRLGESFLVFLSKRYGRQKVMDYLYSLRAVNDADRASKKVFGLEFKELEQRWRNQLKREYFPYIQSHTLPGEYSTLKTKHTEDGSYFNLAPRFSPDGSRYIYYSNKDGRFSIWRGGIFDASQNRRLIKGEATGSMEEFHYLRTNLAWFPDNRHFAYVAKTSTGDVIHKADYESGEIVTSYVLPGFKAIYEIDVAPDGKSCILAGQKDMQTDLYWYDFTTGSIRQLTDDSYSDAQPRFSPDGQNIAYASEQSFYKADYRKGYFSTLHSDICIVNLATGISTRVTQDDFNCTHPVWDSTGTKLTFISEQDSIPNLEQIDLTSSTRTKVTRTLSGVYSFDLTANSNYLVYSCFFNGGWDIFLKSEPMADLTSIPYQLPNAESAPDTLLSRIDLSRLGLYGERVKHKPVTDGGPMYIQKNSTVLDFAPGADSLRLKPDFSWDDRPDSAKVMPAVKPYKIKLRLDSFFGGFAYSSSVGTIGNLEMGLSDVMGNHAIGISLAIAGKIKDSNLVLTYLYLPKRIDHGFGVYNLLDEVIYYYPGFDDFYRERIRETGLYYLLRYPFNKFIRMDFENMLYSWEYHWDYWLQASADNSAWINDIVPKRTDLIYEPAVSFVHDNALYGSTGPMLGWKGYLTLRKSFALHNNDYHTVYADFRSYSLFSKRYSLALRMVGGFSGGKHPQSFDLNGYYGVRGLEDDLTGEKIAMFSTELRYPFLDYLSIAFPVPITLTSLRGSAFADLGSVWNRNSAFQGMSGDKLKDLHLGFGFGPRLNIGFAVLKFDFAWLTDLSNISKPTYYFSLTEDF